MTHAEPLVDLRDLEIRRGAFRLAVPAWQVPPGAVVGLVGPTARARRPCCTTWRAWRPGTRAWSGSWAWIPPASPAGCASRWAS